MYAQKWIIYYVFYRRSIFKGLTGGALSTDQTPSLASTHHNNNNSRFLVSGVAMVGVDFMWRSCFCRRAAIVWVQELVPFLAPRLSERVVVV